MAIVPMDTDRVVAYGFDVLHFRTRFIHLERIRLLGLREAGLLGLGSVRARANRARAFISQKRDAVAGMVTILPVDFDAFGLRDCDVFRVDVRARHWVRSMSRTPGMRRMLPVTFSNCRLSLISTV